MSRPAYRERTERFRNLRNSFKHTKYIHSQEAHVSNVDTSLLSTSSSVDTTIIVPIAPIWMQNVEDINHNIQQIEAEIEFLKQYHNLRQRVVFEDYRTEQYDVCIQENTKSVMSLFKSCKTKLQNMTINEGDDSMPVLERKVRYNAMCSRATRVQELSKVFHNAQRQFLQQMKIKHDRAHKYIDNESVTIANILPDLSNIYDVELNQEQLQRIQTMKEDATYATQQILMIVKSVHELAELFNDLSQLVHEEGSLLNRIDYNMEQTLNTLHKTAPIVRKTNQYQKGSKTALCIIVLIMLIIILGLLLVLRHTVFGNN